MHGFLLTACPVDAGYWCWYWWHWTCGFLLTACPVDAGYRAESHGSLLTACPVDEVYRAESHGFLLTACPVDAGYPEARLLWAPSPCLPRRSHYQHCRPPPAMLCGSDVEMKLSAEARPLCRPSPFHLCRPLWRPSLFFPRPSLGRPCPFLRCPPLWRPSPFLRCRPLLRPSLTAGAVMTAWAILTRRRKRRRQRRRRRQRQQQRQRRQQRRQQRRRRRRLLRGRPLWHPSPFPPCPPLACGFLLTACRFGALASSLSSLAPSSLIPAAAVVPTGQRN